MRLLAVAVIWIMMALPSWADIAAPESVKDTLVLMRDRLRANTLVTDIVVDFDESYVQYQFDGTGPHFNFPDNLHTRLINAETDAERSDILEGFVQNMIAGVAASQSDAPINVQNVYPVIRHQSLSAQSASIDTDHDNHEGHDEKEDKDDANYAIVSFPFVADMRVYLVEDTPQAFKFVTQQALAQIDMSPDALMIEAVMNTRLLEAQLQVQSQGGLHFLQLDGNYETSFLALPSIWNALAAQESPLVAVVAARDLVLFVDGSDPLAVANLRAVTSHEAGQFAYPVSSALITWKDGRWQAFD